LRTEQLSDPSIVGRRLHALRSLLWQVRSTLAMKHNEHTSTRTFSPPPLLLRR
jgi:hypothetical protein